MSKYLEDLLHEADNFFIREDVLKEARELQKKNGMTLEEACTDAFLKLKKEYSQYDVKTTE